MKDEIIIKILDRASTVLNPEQIRLLQEILDEVLYHYKVEQESTALAIIDNMPGMLQLFLAAKKIAGLSPKTIKNYQFLLHSFSDAIRKDVEQVTSMDIRIYLAHYSKREVKTSTLSTVISILKSFFNWLEDEDYIQKSPMRKIQSIRVDKYIRKALSPEELEMLRVACKTPRDKSLIEFFYSTGCRLDEVFKLNRTDIDWSTNSCLVFGKGKKERRVYLNAKARVYLWLYLNSRKDENDALFVGAKKPNKRLSKRSIEVKFRDLGRSAGIVKKVYPHLLRHTMATSLITHGASLVEVQRLLGHESPATTQIYAQMSTDLIQQAHKKYLA